MLHSWPARRERSHSRAALVGRALAAPGKVGKLEVARGKVEEVARGNGEEVARDNVEEVARGAQLQVPQDRRVVVLQCTREVG